MGANQATESISKKNNRKTSTGKRLFYVIAGILIFLLFAIAFLKSLKYIIVIPIFAFLLITGGKHILTFLLFIMKIMIHFWAVLIALAVLIKIFA